MSLKNSFKGKKYKKNENKDKNLFKNESLLEELLSKYKPTGSLISIDSGRKKRDSKEAA